MHRARPPTLECNWTCFDSYRLEGLILDASLPPCWYSHTGDSLHLNEAVQYCNNGCVYVLSADVLLELGYSAKTPHG